MVKWQKSVVIIEILLFSNGSKYALQIYCLIYGSCTLQLTGCSRKQRVSTRDIPVGRVTMTFLPVAYPRNS